MARNRHAVETRPLEATRDQDARETVALLLAAGTAAPDGDCARLLEDLSSAIRHRHAAERFLDQVRQLERRYPGGFFAGAVAGFMLGHAAGESPSPAGAAGTDGIANAPCRTAQTGAGGLGYLETPAAGDEPK